MSPHLQLNVKKKREESADTVQCSLGSISRTLHAYKKEKENLCASGVLGVHGTGQLQCRGDP